MNSSDSTPTPHVDMHFLNKTTNQNVHLENSVMHSTNTAVSLVRFHMREGQALMEPLVCMIDGPNKVLATLPKPGPDGKGGARVDLASNPSTSRSSLLQTHGLPLGIPNP
ncbi:hypothetical protein RND71_023318 [Anisodus tanguticus]|uniref:Uncharacterized protein n=1 Tax=Anisodus tanguticus TaxID=243964 RepID=A0AAE1RVC2_9SOLA|nr:hypothetical protein RND71_023318 [Anisodus tanguticus]